MTTEERLKKAIHRVNSAILHVKALYEECPDDELRLALGHLQQASEKIESVNYAHHHEGKKMVQAELEF